MSTQEAITVPSPVKLSRRFLPFSTVDKIVLGLALLWTMALMSLFDNVGAAAGIAMTVFLLFPLSWGRVYDYALTRCYDAILAVAYQNKIWENTALLTDLGEYVRPVWWRRVLQKLLRLRRLAYPLRVDWMDDTPFGQVGVGHNINAKTDSVVIMGDGSDLTHRTQPEQLMSLMAFGDSIKRLSAGSDVSVALIARPRPANVAVFDDSVDASFHPEAVLPAALITERQSGIDAEALFFSGQITREELRWRRLYNVDIVQPREGYEKHAVELDYAVVLTLPRDPRIRMGDRRWRAKLVSSKDARRLPIIRVLKATLTALTNFGVQGLKVLDKLEVERFLADRRVNEPLEDTHAVSPWFRPQRGIYGSQHMTTVDGVHCVAYRVSEMPSELALNGISVLSTHTSADVTLAVLGENTRGKKEGAGLYSWSLVSNSLTEDMNLPKSLRNKQSRTEEAAERLAESGNVQYMNILAVVSSEDPEQLADDCDSLEREAAANGLYIELVPGSSLQWSATLAATTGMVRI